MFRYKNLIRRNDYIVFAQILKSLRSLRAVMHVDFQSMAILDFILDLGFPLLDQGKRPIVMRSQYFRLRASVGL